MHSMKSKLLADWQQIPAQRRGVYVIAVSLMLVAAAWKFITAPMLAQANADKRSAQFAVQQAAIYEKFAAGDVKKELWLKEQKLRQLEKQLPAKADVNKIAGQCYAMAAKSGVQLQGLKMPDESERKIKASPQQNKGAGNIDVQLEFSGSYKSVMNFIYKLEKQNSLMQLMDVNIKGDAAKDLLRVTCVLRIFVQVQAGVPPANEE